LFGVFPHSLPFQLGPSVLAYMEPTIERQTGELASWTKHVKQPELAAAEAAATEESDVAQRLPARREVELAAPAVAEEEEAVVAGVDEGEPIDSAESPLAVR